MKRHVLIAGTRPEIIKVAPLIRNILQKKLELFFIYSGQHYDRLLSVQIINDLELPLPNLSFELKTSTPASQIAEIMTNLDGPLNSKQDDVVIIQGDTNSVLAAALTSVKLGKPLAHIEAGLRSFDWRMPEEHNRRMVDHISNILLAPTKRAKQNLLDEHVYGKIHVTGNTVMDAVKEHVPLAEKKSTVLNKIKFSEYILVTLHRAENVDDAKILGNIVSALRKAKMPIVIPLHPRTKKMLIHFGLFDKLKSARHVQIVPPQGYLDFLMLIKNCKFIITDSGGIQEEATSPLIAKRFLVLRQFTERPEAIEVGVASLIRLKSQDIIEAMKSEWDKDFKLLSPSPFGDGSASKKILEILRPGQ